MLTFFFQSCHCCPSHVHDKWQAAVQPSLCCLVLLSGKFQSKSCVKRALQDVRRSNYYNEILKKKLVEGRMNERKNTYSYWYRTDVVLRKATVLLRGQIQFYVMFKFQIPFSLNHFTRPPPLAGSTCSIVYIFYFIHLLWFFFVSEQCYLYKNEQGQNDIVTTLLPSSAAAGKY